MLLQKCGGFSAPGTTVGATSWLEGGQIHIRVYVGDKGKITEHCWDKDQWYIGQFKADGDGAAATSWLVGSQIFIRVYVREATGKYVEYCWDKGPWYRGGYPG